MNKFDSLIFKPFLLTEIFNIHSGKGAPKKEKGSIPYIAASFQNNGIVGYVDQAKYPGGWLSFVKDGDGGAGTCFYQPAPFWPSNHVYALEPKFDNLDEKTLVFISASITHQCFPKYNRGNAANISRLSQQKIMLPAIESTDGEFVIDWQGIKLVSEEIFRKPVQDATLAIKGIEKAEYPDLLFKPLKIIEVFESIESSKAVYNNSDLNTSGDKIYPFVSRTKENNGVSDFCSKQNKSPEAGNAITIGLDTQTVGYQPAEFYTGQNIQVLRHQELDEITGPVLATAVRDQIKKFSWGGNGATLGRLHKTHIVVPVIESKDSSYSVDWNGLRQFGEHLRSTIEQQISVPLDRLI